MLKLLILKGIKSKRLSTPFFSGLHRETEVLVTGLPKTTGPSSEQAITLSGFRLYKPCAPSLTTRMRRKKVYKKTFEKVVRKFSEDRPRRAGSTPYFINCSQPVHSPGLRAAEQTCHCPGMASSPELSRSHLRGTQPRSPEGVLTDPARYLRTGDDFYEKH